MCIYRYRFIDRERERDIDTYMSFQALLSGTFPPNCAVIGFTIEGVFLLSMELSTEGAPVSVMLSAPSVKFVKQFKD